MIGDVPTTRRCGVSVNSKYYGYDTDLELMIARRDKSSGIWREYYDYLVDKAEYWIGVGSDEWPNAIEPKGDSIDWFACNRAKQEADERFSVVYEDIGIDAEGRYL